MERERQSKVKKMREERGLGSSEEGKDITAIGLLQRSADLVSSGSDESEDDGMLVSEGEELEEIDESGFGKLLTSSQGMYGFLSVCQWR